MIVNGFPKTGTHALSKGIELLGVPTQLTHHAPGDEGAPTGEQIVIYRHPRNVAISWLRFIGKPLAQGNIIRVIRQWQDGSRSFAHEYGRYLPWRDLSFCVRYEDLVASDACLRSLAVRLNVDYLEDAFPNLPGLTATWTGAPSRWEDHWTPAIETAWAEEGAAQLQADLGY